MTSVGALQTHSQPPSWEKGIGAEGIGEAGS